MKLLDLSIKEIIFINAILSLLIGLVGANYLYASWRNHHYLEAKLHHLNRPIKMPQAKASTELINTAELLQYLKTDTPMQVKLIMSSQEADGLHLKVSGKLESINHFVNVLATSALKDVSLEQNKEGYSLSLNLINLRLCKPQGEKHKQIEISQKIVGSVSIKQHHYCVIKDAQQKIHLKEQQQC